MSYQEIEQVRVLELLLRKEITQKTASEMTQLSVRQIRRKVKIFRYHGQRGLVHKNRGKLSNRKWSQEIEAFALKLLKNEWHDFGPTFASEKLLELHNITVSNETLRKSMIDHGLWTAKERTIRHRIRRMRKAAFGMMIQIDGSPHDWFEGRGSRCTLLVFIDDATSKIVWLEFAQSESYNAIASATWNYFKHYGIPQSIYVDYGSVFSVNTNNPERDKITQYERGMKELSVRVIHARSPQAKGRVERSNSTHQDRLVKELRLKNISNNVDANQFLQDYYLDKHNIKFAKEPADSINVHRPIQGIDLNNILCIKEERILANDFTIMFNKRIFQLDAQQCAPVKPKDLITVNVHLDHSIHLSIRKTDLFFKEISERKAPIIKEKIVESKHHKPNENSRRWNGGQWLKNHDKSEQQSARVE